MTTHNRNLLSLFEYSADEIRTLIQQGKVLKKERAHTRPQVLAGKTGVLIFEKPSLRTRITFELAIHELGGHALNLPADTVRMGVRETVADVAKNLDRWVHLIIARTYSQKTIEELANQCSIPVVNALTDQYHPCQALAFALTLSEHRPAGEREHVVFIGDGNNVCSSLMILCAKLGYHFTLACPAGYESPADQTNRCRALAVATGSRITITNDVQTAVSTATAVYTDVWTSMGQENESDARKKIFSKYQVNRELMTHAPTGALVSHCLPAHRGEEITSDVLDSPHSVAFDEAENRLHIQKAIIIHLFS